MKPQEQYLRERLSLKGQSCTVRYVGPVADKPGDWLGVEWDDATRGKHNGSHDGKVYFHCRSTSSTAASFLRPTQAWDTPRTFLQALREKYMPEFHESEAEIVYISGKQAEEIGFEKFHQRQAKLQGIHVLVLDHMRIKHQFPDLSDQEAIAELCADITELDLTGNLFETFDEIVDLCRQLPRLRTLTLDRNRFSIDIGRTCPALPTVKTLSLSRTLLNQSEINKLIADNAARTFPSLSSLALANNELSGPLSLTLPQSLTSLDLTDNDFNALSDLIKLQIRAPPLQTVILKRNRISRVCADAGASADLTLRVVELDLSYNQIDSFSFFNAINATTLPDLKHLRVTGNPAYKSLVSADGKSLTAGDGYMLTIARLPQLEFLNYSKITEKERLDAETYYLGQIAIELAKEPQGHESDVLARHPRYKELCEEYGEPSIQRKVEQDEINPNSLAARLVSIDFQLAPTVLPNLKQRSWIEEIPKSFSIYAVLGMVGKRLAQMPLDLRLILETSERDPVARDSGYGGPEWWDSSDDDADQEGDHSWIRRDVEMVAGTRTLGTFVEGREATVRIETRIGDG